MKVLLIASWWPTDREPAGGAFIEDQARILARSHDVFVIAPDQQRWNVFPRWRLRSPSLTRRSGYLCARPVFFSSVPRHPRSMIRGFAGAVRRSAMSAAQIWGAPDVIHAHASLPAGYAATAVSRSTGVPLVLTEHSWPSTLHLERPVEGRFAREAISGASVRLAVSEPLAAAYRDLTGLDFRVIPNAVDLEFFDRKHTDQTRVDDVIRFALVGRLVPRRKGVDVALEAAAAMRDMGRRWHIDIVGDGVERAVLERRAAELGLERNVTFRGYRTREEIRQLLARTDFLLAPSRSETFGVAAIEAMAMGVPVIASNTGGLATTVTPETGVLVEPGDPSSLATTMRAAIEGRLTFDPSAVRASVRVRFGADALLARLTAVYQDACGLRREDKEV